MNYLEVSIDFLSWAGKTDRLKDLEDSLDFLAGLLPVKDNWYTKREGRVIGQKFSNTINSVNGIYGAFGIKEEQVKFTVQLQGSFCRQIDPLKALQGMSQYKLTRLDIAIDDYKRRVSQKTIAELGRRGHYKGLDSFRLIGSKGSQDDEDVKTCYFGKALKQVRFYDAEFMHGIPADRWELQLRGECAETIQREILQRESLEGIGKYLTGTIDFIQPGENWYQAKRYKFWQQLRDDLGEAKVKSPCYQPSLDKMLRWLDRQVACSMSVLRFGIGEEQFKKYCLNLAERKLDKLDTHHLAWIDYLQRSRETIA